MSDGAPQTSIPLGAMPAGVEAEPELHPALPDSIVGWVAALSLLPEITEAFFRLNGQALGTGPSTEWNEFTRHASQLALIEPGPEPDTYVFRTEWSGRLEKGLDLLGGTRSVKSKLLDAWLAGPDPNLIPSITMWARDLARWDVLERVWLILGERTGELSEQTLNTFRLLPLEAREARPILTWASGAAASLLVDAPEAKIAVLWERLLLDSAMLHSNWSSRQATDDAVIGGTFRIIGEQRLPGTQAGQSLDAAWRTKQEIDAFIDARSRVGKGPGRLSQAVFRAFSARLALSRYDAVGAVNEARWARLLSDWEPVSLLAAGVEALALSVSSNKSPVRKQEPTVAAIDDRLGAVGLRGLGQIYTILADGRRSSRKIDQDGVDRCLELVSLETSAQAGVWSLRLALAGMRASLWGDPDKGLHEMAEGITHLSTIGREQDEPIGKWFLDQTRVVLLTRAGSFADAEHNAGELPERVRTHALAWIQLCSGQYSKAAALAGAMPYEPAQGIDDRHSHVLVQAAGALLGGTFHDDLRRDAIRELRWLVETGSFVRLALLPTAARDALIELISPEMGPSNPNFAALLDRLSQLNDSGRQSAGSVRLTDREQVLLPLLATNGSVPQIARTLHVSANTLRKQVATLRQKFEAGTRAELIHKARKYGLLP